MTRKDLTIGQRIKVVIEAEGITQKQVAKDCYVSTVTVGNYTRDRNEPTYSFLANLCKAYDLRADWLLLGKGRMYVNPHNKSFSEAEEQIAKQVLFRAKKIGERNG